MTLPAVTPNWASDTNFTSGPETGTATKVDPGAGYNAQGFVPDNAFIGPYVNYTLYWVTQFCAWCVGLHNDAQWLGRLFVWTALHRFTAGLRASAIQLVTGGDMLYTDSAGVATTRLRTREIPLALGSYNGSLDWSIAGAGNAYTLAAPGAGGGFESECPISNATLPDGSILRLVRGWGNDGGGTLTVTLGYYPITNAFGAIGAFVAVATGTSTGANVLVGTVPNTTANHTIDHSSRRYVLHLHADAVAAAKTVNAVYCTIDDPGFVGN